MLRFSAILVSSYAPWQDRTTRIEPITGKRTSGNNLPAQSERSRSVYKKNKRRRCDGSSPSLRHVTRMLGCCCASLPRISLLINKSAASSISGCGSVDPTGAPRPSISSLHPLTAVNSFIPGGSREGRDGGCRMQHRGR